MLRERFGDDLDIRQLPQRLATQATLPEWVNPTLAQALEVRGISSLWPHQLEALDLAHLRNNIVVSTGTASGKSLCYQIPIAQAVLENPKARALYLAPTKALARDQVRALDEFHISGLHVSAFDGDSDFSERSYARDHANLVVTNPDMIHHALLPIHARWASFFRNLEIIAVDECHMYRGMFGAHVANVLKRLIRIAQHHGSTPQIIMASATVSSPAAHAQMLTGQKFHAIENDTSPRGAITIALALPKVTLGRDIEGESIRRSAIAEAADVFSDLVATHTRTLVFVRSRKAAETVATIARDNLTDSSPELVSKVTSYRAGYLPEERRAIERQLRSGEVLGVATTNALELGVDISGLDATILTGWPGTRASFWQQVGRAGREQQAALALMIASDNPLDHYLVNHPESIFDQPVEAAVCDPTNSNILYSHLACAASELHLTNDDLPTFGESEKVLSALQALTTDGLVRQRATGWFWAGIGRAHNLADLRGSGRFPYHIVESGTGRLLGTIDADAAFRQVHAGAVYTHLGETFLVDQLDIDNGVAFVTATQVDFSTYAREITTVEIVEAQESKTWGPFTLTKGMVDVTEQVIGYQRRRMLTGQIIGDDPLDLPALTLRTQSMWWTATAEALSELQIGDVAGCVHAAEHAAIGMLPLFTLCDRSDIGGVSMAEHPDTEQATVFIYDGYSGGAGFSHHGYDVADQWLAATHNAIAECQCLQGCPACVQSPKCGNNNHPLDKAAAARMLNTMATHSK